MGTSLRCRGIRVEIVNPGGIGTGKTVSVKRDPDTGKMTGANGMSVP